MRCLYHTFHLKRVIFGTILLMYGTLMNIENVDVGNVRRGAKH
jgi:hypothetical protein